MSWGGVIFEIHYLNNKIKKRIQPLNLEVESPSTLLPLYRRRFSLVLSCVMLMECRVGGGLFGATRIIPQRSSSYSHQKRIFSQGLSPCRKRSSFSSISNKLISAVPRCSGSSNSTSDEDEDKTSNSQKTKPFGYSRKDVILIGVGVTAAGVGLKSGLEYVGVDPLQAGNVVQLVLVLGLTIGWISTYIFRVSNKEMTYAQQLRDYEDKVMQKRLESLTEAEIEALYEQVEEEKRRLSGEQVK